MSLLSFKDKIEVPFEQEDKERFDRQSPIEIENTPKIDINNSISINEKLKYLDKETKPIASEMGTTAVICLIKQNYIYISNVGDSMAVMYKNGKAEQLTVEHKVSLSSERARIEKSGARVINNRIEGRLNLTRAIGNYLS